MFTGVRSLLPVLTSSQGHASRGQALAPGTGFHFGLALEEDGSCFWEPGPGFQEPSPCPQELMLFPGTWKTEKTGVLGGPAGFTTYLPQ
mgnify:CR=1 FL=1